HDGVVPHLLLELAGLEQVPGQIVDPDALAERRKLVQIRFRHSSSPFQGLMGEPVVPPRAPSFLLAVRRRFRGAPASRRLASARLASLALERPPARWRGSAVLGSTAWSFSACFVKDSPPLLSQGLRSASVVSHN